MSNICLSKRGNVKWQQLCSRSASPNPHARRRVLLFFFFTLPFASMTKAPVRRRRPPPPHMVQAEAEQALHALPAVSVEQDSKYCRGTDSVNALDGQRGMQVAGHVCGCGVVGHVGWGHHPWGIWEVGRWGTWVLGHACARACRAGWASALSHIGGGGGGR